MKNAGALSWSEVESGEAALIARCTTGDEAACAELVAAPAHGLRAGIQSLGNRDDALDLSQDVFLRVFRTLSSFRGPVSASHLDLPHRRQPGTQPSEVVAAAASGEQVSLDDYLRNFGDLEARQAILPDRLLASKETAAKIWQAMDHLPFEQRTALILREVDGLRYDEIAYSLDIAVGTVKSRLTRARQALRAELLGLRT